MNLSIGLIDYGMGNLYSVQNSFKRLGQEIKVIKTPVDLKRCNSLILPGVGAFDPAMRNLESTNLIPDIIKWTKEGNPILGICLGLQLMFETSEEGELEGLSLFKGKVKKLPTDENERIPHMGWSVLKKNKDCPLLTKSNENNWMYFVHSYSAVTQNPKEIAATVQFGSSSITSIVWKQNIGACQFHPEKSGKSGALLLSRWIDWIKKEYKS